MPDAIQILEEDHRKVEALFDQYRSSKDPKVVEQICNQLSVHAVVEESLVYPAIAAEMPEAQKRQPEFVQEHMEVKNAIAQIKLIGFEDPGVEALVQTVIEGVTHHVGEEERELFPMVRKTLPPELLDKLGKMASIVREQETKAVESATSRILGSGGGGGGADIDLNELSKDEIYEMAAEKGISGRSDMTKDELIKALQNA